MKREKNRKLITSIEGCLDIGMEYLINHFVYKRDINGYKAVNDMFKVSAVADLDFQTKIENLQSKILKNFGHEIGEISKETGSEYLVEKALSVSIKNLVSKLKIFITTTDDKSVDYIDGYVDAIYDCTMANTISLLYETLDAK